MNINPTPPSAEAVAAETPRTDRLRDSILDAFKRYHKGEIYLEDFAGFVRLAFNDAAHIERELIALSAALTKVEAELATAIMDRDANHDMAWKMAAERDNALARGKEDGELLDWIIKNDAHCVLDDGSLYDKPEKWDVFISGKLVASDFDLRLALSAARTQNLNPQEGT